MRATRVLWAVVVTLGLVAGEARHGRAGEQDVLRQAEALERQARDALTGDPPYERAELLAGRAFALKRKALGDQAPALGTALALLAEIRLATEAGTTSATPWRLTHRVGNQVAGLTELYRRALRHLDRAGVETRDLALRLRVTLGALYRRLGAHRRASHVLQEALTQSDALADAVSRPAYFAAVEEALWGLDADLYGCRGSFDVLDQRDRVRPHADRLVAHLENEDSSRLSHALLLAAVARMGRGELAGEVEALLQRVLANNEAASPAQRRLLPHARILLGHHRLDQADLDGYDEVVTEAIAKMQAPEAADPDDPRDEATRAADRFTMRYAKDLGRRRRGVATALKKYRDVTEGQERGSVDELRARAGFVVAASTQMFSWGKVGIWPTLLAPRIHIEREIHDARERTGETSSVAGLKWLGLEAFACMTQGRHDAALRLYRAALEQLAPLRAKRDASALRRDLLAGLALLHVVRDDLTAALDVYERLYRALCPEGVASGVPGFVACVNLAGVANETQRFERAHEALDVAMACFEADPALHAWAERAGAYFDLVRVLCAHMGRADDVALLARLLPLPAGCSPASASVAPRWAGQLREAIEAAREQRLHFLTSVDEDKRVDVADFDWIARQVHVAEAMTDYGQHDVAYAELRACLEHYVKRGLSPPGAPMAFVSPQHTARAACEAIALAAARRGSTDEAIAYATRAFDLYQACEDVRDRRVVPGVQSEIAEQLVLLHLMRRVPQLPDVASQAPEIVARLHLDQHHTTRAFAALDAAITRMRARVPEGHPRIARLLVARAEAHLACSDLEAAQRDAVLGLTQLAEALGEAHPHVVEARIVAADCALRRGASAEALTLYKRASVDARGAFFEAHPLVMQAESGMAMARAAVGDASGSITALQSAIARLERQLEVSFAGASHPQRVAISGSVQWLLANWLALTRGRQHGYDEVLRLTGRAHRALAAEVVSLRFAKRREIEAAQAFEAARRAVAGIGHMAPRPAWRRAVWRRRYAEAVESYDEARKRLLRRSSAFRKDEAVHASLSAEALARRLETRDVLVDVMLVGGRYVAWVLRNGEPVQRLELGAQEDLEDLLHAFRESAWDPDAEAGSVAVAGEALSAALGSLWSLVLRDGTTHLYLVVDAAFAGAPIEALPVSEGTPLGERLSVTRLHAASALLPRTSDAHKTRGALLLGGADFDWRPPTQPITGSSDRLLDRVPDMRPFVHLPGAQIEVEQVARVYRRIRGTASLRVLAGNEATEAQVRAHAPGKQVLHFATHGYLRDRLDARLRAPKEAMYRLREGLAAHARRFDPLLLSGLALSGANTRNDEGADDGLLTGLEVLDLDLAGTRLVFLSACETADSVGVAGEGSVSLVRAFRLAGAAQVVGTLWPVDDAATQRFAEAFYDVYFRSRSAQRALAAARKALRAEARYDHPRFYAAFVLYGPATAKR